MNETQILANTYFEAIFGDKLNRPNNTCIVELIEMDMPEIIVDYHSGRMMEQEEYEEDLNQLVEEGWAMKVNGRLDVAIPLTIVDGSTDVMGNLRIDSDVIIFRTVEPGSWEFNN